MKSLLEVIHCLTEFPELYIGKPSLERLYAFIGGYLFQNEQSNDHCLDGFNEYVAKKYRIDSDHNWASIIQFFSNNERDAFNTFITLFEEFQSKRDLLFLHEGKDVIP